MFLTGSPSSDIRALKDIMKWVKDEKGLMIAGTNLLQQPYVSSIPVAVYGSYFGISEKLIEGKSEVDELENKNGE